MINTHEKYMETALSAARTAALEDEVPVGAVVVSKDGEVLSIAHNTGEHGKTALAHAEITALKEAALKLNQTRLWDCTLYVTLEPCAMCAAALAIMRIKTLVFGALNPKGGAVINGVQYYQNPSCNHRPEIISGIKEEECSALLTSFFKQKRQTK
ncbi:MAG: nucleoside deaminase [Alphaproteobacteria bacterium]|nr:nucleoside deaminase [Alphaproteobacteria bacterium]